MDRPQEPIQLRPQASSCLEKLKEVKQHAEDARRSHKTASTQRILQTVQNGVNNSLRHLQAWITEFDKGRQADNTAIINTTARLFDDLQRLIGDVRNALTSRLRHRRLWVIGFIIKKRKRLDRNLNEALQKIETSLGGLQGLLKIILVTSAKQADRERRKTVVLKETSHTYNAFHDFFDKVNTSDLKPQYLLSQALQTLWEHFPYWQELHDKVGNAEDPGDGMFYNEDRVTKANGVLQDLHQAWLDTPLLAGYPPPQNLLKMAKICLIISGMRRQTLLEDFLQHGSVDQNLPLDKDEVRNILRPKHVDYAATFYTEQYRAVPREWENGAHIVVDDEEPLPLVHERHYDTGAYGTVYRVRDLFSGDKYARKDQIVALSAQDKAAARKHLEEERERLKNMEHRHIVQVVKTYQRGEKYGILLRPAATSDLEKLIGRFIKDKFYHEEDCKDSKWLRPLFLTAFGCLSHGLAYIHGRKIRHKDVKPANILYEKAMRTNGNVARFLWADFGLAYDFSETGNSKTRSTKLYSPRYAAPEILAASRQSEARSPRPSIMSSSRLDEIIENEKEMTTNTDVPAESADEHGRASDIFSLGCVFLEMLAGLVKEKLPLKKNLVQEKDDEKLMFGYNISDLRRWAENWVKNLEVPGTKEEELNQWTDLKPLFSLAASMIHSEHKERPPVDEVVAMLAKTEITGKTGCPYFCEACWNEVERQGDFPSKQSTKPSSPASPSSPSSPTSSKSQTGMILKRIDSPRPQLKRLFSRSSTLESSDTAHGRSVRNSIVR